MAWYGPGSSTRPGQADPYARPQVIATPYNPFPGHSNAMFPGETGEQASRRMLLQYNLRGQRDLPPEWDANMPGGGGVGGLSPLPSAATFAGSSLAGSPTVGGAPGYTVPSGGVPGGASGFGGTGAGGVPGFGQGGNAEALLAEQRQLAFDRIASMGDTYENDPLAQAIQQGFMGTLGGDSLPFTDEVTNSLLSDVSDSNAEALAAQQDQIRSAMANAGLGGSGMALSAGLNARRAAQSAIRKGRREVKSRASLENFAAQERARQAASNYMAQKAAQRRAQAQMEVDLRKRFEVTGDAGLNQFAGVLGQALNQGQASGGPQSSRTATGTNSARGGVNSGNAMGLSLVGFGQQPTGNDNRNYGPQRPAPRYGNLQTGAQQSGGQRYGGYRQPQNGIATSGPQPYPDPAQYFPLQPVPQQQPAAQPAPSYNAFSGWGGADRIYKALF